MGSKRITEFPDRYINRAWARQKWGDMADSYAGFLTKGDSLADAVVESFAAMKPGLGHRMLGKALDEGIEAVPEAPKALRALFAHVDHVPAWVDSEILNLGARTYQRTGAASMLVLSAWSLMNGYHTAPAVKPLAFTKQLDAMAPRRLAETGRFVLETIQEDGLRRFSEGFKLAVRVRIMHALVRKTLKESDFWNFKSWGIPINQADMSGTVIEFSGLMLKGTRMLGYRFTEAESEAVIHLWRYAGYLSGVDEHLLQFCDSEAHMHELAEMVYSIQPGPDEDSLALAAALRKVAGHQAEAVGERMLAEFMTRYHDGLTWAFNGPEISADLRIPNKFWRLALYPTQAMVGTVERLRRMLPGGTSLMSRLGNQYIRTQVEQMLEQKEPTFLPAIGPSEIRKVANAA